MPEKYQVVGVWGTSGRVLTSRWKPFRPLEFVLLTLRDLQIQKLSARNPQQFGKKSEEKMMKKSGNLKEEIQKNQEESPKKRNRS